jgi:GTPase SAR1 family protein
VHIDFEKKVIELDGARLMLISCDTFGKERQMILIYKMLKKMNGVILVYETTKIETFNNLREWMRIIMENSNYPDTNVILVAHQLDNLKQRKVSTEQGMEFASEFGITYIEANALTGFNVD